MRDEKTWGGKKSYDSLKIENVKDCGQPNTIWFITCFTIFPN